MYIKIVTISFLLVSFPHVLRVLYLLGLHVVVFNHVPGPCRLVPGVEFGSEDMETLPNGLTFITSGFRWSLSSPTMKEHYKKNDIKGKILLYDFNKPDEGVTELGFSEDFDQTMFAPHGLSVYHSKETGKVTLFVVNHLPGYDSIEKFEFKEEDMMLEFVESYVDEKVHLVNDVAAVSENRFYFTNYAHSRGLFRFTLEVFFLLPWGNIMYYDGMKYRRVQDGLVIPNGILLSKDKRSVYLANGGFHSLNIYRREVDGNLTLTQEYPLHSSPDNLLLDPDTGNIVTGAHPSTYQIAEHLKHYSKPAPSQVLLIHLKNDTYANYTTDIYSEEGHTLYGSSVASIYHGKMLIGSIQHKLLLCELNVPL